MSYEQKKIKVAKIGTRTLIQRKLRTRDPQSTAVSVVHHGGERGPESRPAMAVGLAVAEGPNCLETCTSNGKNDFRVDFSWTPPHIWLAVAVAGGCISP